MFYYNRILCYNSSIIAELRCLFITEHDQDMEPHMRPEFRRLRIRQLESALRPFLEVSASSRPQRGWIRAVREATGVTVREFASRLGKVPSNVTALEKSEAEYRISLGTLRDAADALGCRLVYALVPKSGSVQELSEERARAKASENVHAVEHTMALEDQAVGGVEEKIEEETRRILNPISTRPISTSNFHSKKRRNK